MSATCLSSSGSPSDRRRSARWSLSASSIEGQTPGLLVSIIPHLIVSKLGKTLLHASAQGPRHFGRGNAELFCNLPVIEPVRAQPYDRLGVNQLRRSAHV